MQEEEARLKEGTAKAAAWAVLRATNSAEGMGVDEVIQAGLQASIKCDWNKRNIYHVREHPPSIAQPSTRVSSHWLPLAALKHTLCCVAQHVSGGDGAWQLLCPCLAPPACCCSGVPCHGGCHHAAGGLLTWWGVELVLMAGPAN